MALKSRIDDHDVMFALRGASGIRERPRAAGTAKSIFCGRVFPNQSPFHFRHVGSLLCMRLRLCLLSDSVPFSASHSVGSFRDICKPDTA